MRIVYIHGANATATSFNYIREHVTESGTLLNYNSTTGFNNNLIEMLPVVQKLRGPLFFVAHSLGGIYALHLAQSVLGQVAGAVTMSTPYGGSHEADLVSMFLPSSRLMQDISPTGYPVSSLGGMVVPTGWTNIVTTQGNSPFISSPNDGVVTTNSMRALDTQMKLVELKLNHYEVILSPATVKIIKHSIKKANV